MQLNIYTKIIRHYLNYNNIALDINKEFNKTKLTRFFLRINLNFLE